MQHLLAFRGAATVTATETDLLPIADALITVQNGHYVPGRDVNILWAMAMAANITRARLISPSLRQLTTPFIRPIEPAATPANLPAIADYRNGQLVAKGLEELQVMGIQTSGGAQDIRALLSISDGPLSPAPGGPIFTMRGTGSVALVANVWSLLTITWQDSLPAGRYVVVGLDVNSATAFAGRLIFNDQAWRPGVPGFVDAVRKTDRMFIKGGLGVLGQFNSNVMPQIEMLATAADATQEVYLDLMRVG